MFSNRLKEIRLSKGLTMDELCNEYNKKFNSKLNKSTLSRYENNLQEPMLTVVRNLARILNVEINILTGEDNQLKTQQRKYPSNILPLPKTYKLPLYSNIACGIPIHAEQNIEDYIDTPEDVHADFCLRCNGDSMINARILDGDIVFIREQTMVDDGEIAAVLINDEATLKRVYYDQKKNKLVLNAENPAFAPLVYVGEEIETIHILGKAVYFISLVK